jgi:hypothetical protein
MNDKYLYRFKTRSEFIAEYGWSWTDLMGEYSDDVYWNDGMNSFFGKDFELITKENLHTFDKNVIRINSISYMGMWTITWKMITLKNIQPTYKPKKLSFD